MESILTLIALFSLGFFAGFFTHILFNKLSKKHLIDGMDQLIETQKRQQQEALSATSYELKSAFKDISLQLFSTTSQNFSQLTKDQVDMGQKTIGRELESNRALLDQKINNIQQELKFLAQSITQLEKDRQQKFSELSQVLLQTNDQTSKLISVTTSLNEVLSNSQTRGQWGERLAEDILRLAGFIENVNYKKQVTLAEGRRPDFSFILPHDLTLNMDVKFPIQNYKKSIEAQSEDEKKKYEKMFLADVKTCFKEIANRQYINEQTVDIVLFFIPHEQIFSFIQAKSPELFEEGLKNHIVACSPLTLFAVLAIVRKALDHFTIETSTKEILGHLDAFKKQWEMYCKSFTTLGKKISDLQSEYEKITSTRTNQLDLIFRKIQNQNHID